MAPARVGRIVVPKAVAGLLVVALVAALVVTTVRRAQALPDLGVPESDELLDGRPDDRLARYVVRLEPAESDATDASAATSTGAHASAPRRSRAGW